MVLSIFFIALLLSLIDGILILFFSEIQSILRTGNREGVLSLGEGQPNVETFPFSAVKICIEDGVSFEIEGKDLERALQYSPTKG